MIISWSGQLKQYPEFPSLASFHISTLFLYKMYQPTQFIVNYESNIN